MSAGLAASTVTPGSTAPDESLTTPTMLLCAQAVTGSERNEYSNQNRDAEYIPSHRSLPWKHDLPSGDTNVEIRIRAKILNVSSGAYCKTR